MRKPMSCFSTPHFRNGALCSALRASGGLSWKPKTATGLHAPCEQGKMRASDRGPIYPYSPCLTVVPLWVRVPLSGWNLPIPTDTQSQVSNAALNAGVSCCG